MFRSSKSAHPKSVRATCCACIPFVAEKEENRVKEVRVVQDSYIPPPPHHLPISGPQNSLHSPSPTASIFLIAASPISEDYRTCACHQAASSQA